MVNHIKNKKMNSLKPLHFKFTAILLLICCNSLFSQKIEPKKRITKPDHTIYSKIIGRDYQLYISFPKDYSTKDSISYPVLYVLDGEIFFPIIKEIRKILELGQEIEDIIIVGVSSPDWFRTRFYDFTPTVSTFEEEEKDKRDGAPIGTHKSGGADQFIKSLKTEIIPFVDKNYKTNSDRGIYGHSLAGMFTAYCLLNSDGYFTRFGINSPSFWYDNNKLLNQAVTQFTENKTWDLPQTKVFISVGDQEGEEMLPTMLKYSKYLEKSDYDPIHLKWQIFTEDGHFSVIPGNISKTLSTLYGKKRAYKKT
jgi:predicted alpha/beta superfamily hydrolase